MGFNSRFKVTPICEEVDGSTRDRRASERRASERRASERRASERRTSEDTPVTTVDDLSVPPAIVEDVEADDFSARSPSIKCSFPMFRNTQAKVVASRKSLRLSVCRARPSSTSSATRERPRFENPIAPPILTPRAEMVGYGTIARGNVREVHHTDESLMKSGSVTSSDKRLKEEDYLTEMVPLEDIRKVLLPFGKIRLTWDSIMFVLVAYTALVLPIQLAFSTTGNFPRGLTDFEYAMDFIFMFDIVLNFRTAYVQDAMLVVDRRLIRLNYMRRWFPIDLIGSFPLDLFLRLFNSAGNSTSFVTLVKVLKVPKLLRIGRFLKRLEKVEGAANVGGIFVLCIIMVVIVHWLACLWFLITNSTGYGGWLEANGLMGRVWTEQYLPVFYATLMMVMGDSLDIEADGELVFASTVVIIGACINATIFASVASYVAQLSAISAEHKKKMTWITKTLSSLRLANTGLDARIAQYYEYCWVRHRDFASQQLLDSLPAVFSSRVALAVHVNILRSFPPFRDVGDRFLADIATKLHPEVYQPFAEILVVGQVWHSMYFIKRGKVELIERADSAEHKYVVELDDYFGELTLFTTTKLDYSVRAATHLDCYRLDREDYEVVMKRHPAEAVQVADNLSSMLPPKVGRKVVADIYAAAGLREVLSILQNRKWRPPKGFAERLRKFAQEDATTLERLRQAQRQRKLRRSCSTSLASSQLLQLHAEHAAAAAGEGEAPLSAHSVGKLEAVTERLAAIASAHATLEEDMRQMQQQVTGQCSQLVRRIKEATGRGAG
ncbi:hypothetical protein AB1Y20_009785 [Prymnesium parvum]|uniref:Cyclic nucleotide-binding domain-containing protein n=1 Tax=Prymnesium parvum TaxID=97485 RepID=A0AB34K1V7_PRYPA